MLSRKVPVIKEDKLRVIGSAITTIKARGVTFDITSGHHRQFLDDWLHLILKPELIHFFQRPLHELYELVAVHTATNWVTRIHQFSFAKRIAESHRDALATYLPALNRHTSGADFVAAVWNEMGGDGLPISQSGIERELSRWVQYMVWICQFRCLFVTHNGMMGLGPSTLQENDKLVEIRGCDSLMIIRQIGDFWVLVGQGYVRDLPSPQDEEKFETFDLI